MFKQNNNIILHVISYLKVYVILIHLKACYICKITKFEFRLTFLASSGCKTIVLKELVIQYKQDKKYLFFQITDVYSKWHSAKMMIYLSPMMDPAKRKFFVYNITD
jgi:hypothetical protein